jgi:sugar/nucleoside kinase (ribokinase family)
VSGVNGQVACFSYLAAASLWQVGRFPAANHGAEVSAIEQGIAADAPMVAAVLTAFGQPSLLLANRIGDDRSGDQVAAWLQMHRVTTAAKQTAGIATPQITVVGDSQHTRTMFPFLQGVADELERMDLAPLGSASFAYVDCYGLIQRPAVRMIQAARNAGLPLLANLGGDNPSTEILDALDGYPGLVIQTSITEESPGTAVRLVKYLRVNMQCEWAVITAGKAGTAAAGARELIRTPAFHADVRHTHCAGAAFSGGLIYGLMRGWPMHESLDLASASGALRCERAQDEPLPTMNELRALMQSRQRHTAPAA